MTVAEQGLFPAPPRLFQGTGVTDDEVWEAYWKVENGIRLSGMPGFKDRLTEQQIWEGAVLVKNADKIPESVEKELAEGAGTAMGKGMAQKPRPNAEQKCAAL